MKTAKSKLEPLQAPDPRLPTLSIVRQSTLSERLWGIEWRRHLPPSCQDGILIERSNFSEMVQFAQAHFGEIFGRKEHSLFLKGGQSSAKKIFCETNSDFFSFLSTHKTVGMFSGNATDWESYYIRSISFLKSYQHRGIYQAFLGHLLSVLKENGVKRVDIHIAPNNPVSLYIHLKHGFLISGSVLSENWGVMTQLTKFLDHNSQLVFESQFCTSSWNPIQKLR